MPIDNKLRSRIIRDLKEITKFSKVQPFGRMSGLITLSYKYYHTIVWEETVNSLPEENRIENSIRIKQDLIVQLMKERII